MSYRQRFEHDQQFLRLVRRETDVDLVTAALEIARDGQADLMFEPTRVRLQRSVARLTCAESTPGTRASAFSTRATQLAQVMPTIGKVRVDSEAVAVFMPQR